MTAACATLVVATDDHHRKKLCELLVQGGHRVAAAAGGPEALDLLGREPFDLVLLDVSPLHPEGVAVLQQLKWDSRFWPVPVIVVGGAGSADELARGIDLGAEDYLVEPLHPVLVNLRIGAFLARRRAQELETEYLKVFDEQTADLNELKRELTQRALVQLDELERLNRLRRFLPSDVIDLTAEAEAEARSHWARP